MFVVDNDQDIYLKLLQIHEMAYRYMQWPAVRTREALIKFAPQKWALDQLRIKDT